MKNLVIAAAFALVASAAHAETVTLSNAQMDSVYGGVYVNQSYVNYLISHGILPGAGR